MAYQDQFYTLGTIALTNGQTVVTGTDTGWQTALIVGGVLYAGGGAYPIASVTSEISLTLAIPYTGATAANASYAIDRQRSAATSNVAMNDRLAQIIREITVGNIEVLNSLESVNNLAELAALQTESSRFLVIDETGVFGLLPLDNKLNKPANATDIHLIDGTGAAIKKEDLPVSTPTQTALNSKAEATATQNALNTKANLSGATFTGLVSMKGSVPTIDLVSGNGVNRWRIIGNITDTVDYGIVFQNARTGMNLVEVGAGGRALITYGDVLINGSISKGGGTFLIDHPLYPADRNLRHGFVEAPRYELIYRGSVKLVNGRASVNIDDASDMTAGTFAALTTNGCVTSLQNQDGFGRLRPGLIDQGVFEIICEDTTCTDTVSWVVIAERNDAYVRYLDPNCERITGRFIPEFDKED